LSLDFSSSDIRTWSRLGLCGAFGVASLSLPDINENTVILTADLGIYSGLERFMQQYPDRFYNIGIAEQNLIGVAAGFAKEGMQVFATTYATFAASRCMDQVRVNMGYMNLGIKLIGMTSGLSVGILGATHMSIEDIAIMRAIPNITIISPADGLETIKAVLALAKHDGPVYVRLTGAMPHPIVYKEDYPFTIGKPVTLLEGSDIMIFATGSMVHYAQKATEILSDKGISAGLINIHTIKPFYPDVLEQIKNVKLIVTVEEHSIIGGLGSVLAEHITKYSDAPPLLMLGLNDTYPKAGEYLWLLKQQGLTSEDIADSITQQYQKVNMK